jgi:hypothetical protein
MLLRSLLPELEINLIELPMAIAQNDKWNNEEILVKITKEFTKVAMAEGRHLTIQQMLLSLLKH